MKFAVIDIGSNTAKAEIYKYNNNKLTATAKYIERDMIADHKDGGVLDDECIGVLVNIMNGFAAVCAENGVKRIFPYATQSLRGISNAEQVCERIKSETGLTLRIISGEEEARLGCEAFLQAGNPGTGVLTDMGGGSTEINVIEGGEVRVSVSLPFGSRSLCHEFGIGIFPTPEQAARIKSAVRGFSAGIKAPEGATLFASGGTSAGMFRLFRVVTGRNTKSLSAEELRLFIRGLVYDTVEAEKLARQHTPDRYDTVYAGMLAHLYLCEALGCVRIEHCKTTCRMGYARQLIRNGIIK